MGRGAEIRLTSIWFSAEPCTLSMHMYGGSEMFYVIACIVIAPLLIFQCTLENAECYMSRL